MGGDPFGNMFNDPQLYQKLAANPKTSPYLSDAAFMQKIQQLKSNPAAAAQAMMGVSGVDMLQVRSSGIWSCLETKRTMSCSSTLHRSIESGSETSPILEVCE